MPISRSAKKSLRKAQKNKRANVSIKEKIKTIIKGFLAKPTEEGLIDVQSHLDKAVKHNIYHKNKVSRMKSALSKKVGAPVEKKVVKKAAKKKVVKKKVAAKKM
ncbi:MAG TPA: 30S ribosomal protein S20 [Patescibacteria group bacterium]